MLYIISTPIGNLEDITLRAIRVMSKCEYILCEDTRISRRLLAKYEIKTHLVSFHKFNEKKLQKKITEDLQNKKTIGLISDAGTPLISDPGYNLVSTCLQEDIKVEAIPGPSSIMQALVLSGFETAPFQFLGFLPKKPSDLNFFIKKMLFFDGTSLVFESAKRIKKTVEKIASFDPKRHIAILKELTKKFEKRIALPAQEMAKYLDTHPIKGEIVLAVQKGEIIDDISIDECIKLLRSLHGFDLKEAIKFTAKIKDMPKKEIYNKFLKDKR